MNESINLMTRSTYVVDPAEFQRLRKRNFPKYRAMCRNLVQGGDQQVLLKISEYIIKRPVNERLEEEILLIQKATESFQFFKDLNSKKRNVERKLHQQCCSKMSYRFFKQGDIIFKYNDPADQFYIILEGSVNVFLPMSEDTILTEAYRSRQEFLKLNDHDKRKHAINLIMRAKKHRIKVKLTLPFHLIKLLKRKQHSVEDRGCLSSDRSIVLPDNIANLSPVPPLQDFPNSVKSLTNIEIPSSSSHREIVQEVEVSKDDHHFFEEFEAGKEILRRTGGILPLTMNQLDYFFQDGIFKHNLVATLTSGMMFGELGILMNKPRSATLVAKTSTHVAILKSEDYKLILKEAEMQKMEQRILFFMQNFFQGLPRNIVIKYSYSFKKIKLQRGSHLYLEGDEAKMVFLIKKGDLSIYREVKQVHQGDSSLFRMKYAKSANQLVELAKEATLTKQLSSSVALTICHLVKGQVVGESEIMQRCPRRNSVIVNSDRATLYQLNSAQFLKVMNENYSMRRMFIESIRLKTEWEAQKLNEMKQFSQYRDGIKLNSRALAQTSLQRAQEDSQHNLQDTNIQIPQHDIEIRQLQKGSTKNVVDQLKKKLRHQRNYLKGIMVNSIEFANQLQNDLMEVENQNHQILKLQRQQPSLLPRQEATQLRNSSQQSIKMRAQIVQQRSLNEEFVDRKYVIDYRLSQSRQRQSQDKALNRSTSNLPPPLEEPQSPQARTIIQAQLSNRQQEILKQIKYVTSYSHTNLFLQDGITIKSYANAQGFDDISTRIKTNPTEDISKFESEPREVIKANHRATLISSKHNQFRPKPKKHYLLGHYYSKQRKGKIENPSELQCCVSAAF